MIHLKTLLAKKSIKNSIWIISEKIYQMLINFVLTFFTSRYLGPANYGVLNYGATLVNLFLVIMKLGLDNILVNELIKNRENEGKILGTSIIMRLISSGISVISLSIIVLILQNNSPVIVITSIIQSLAIVFQTFNALDYWFQSYHKSKYVSIAKGVAYTIMALYKIWLLLTEKSVIWFAAATVIDYLVISTFLLFFYKKNQTQKLSFDKSLIKKLFSKSKHFIISGLVVLIYTQIDKIMIGQMQNETELGYYSSALAICTLCAFIPEAIITSARTVIFEAKKNNNDYLKKLKETYSLVFWICFAMSLLTTLLSPYIISIVYGNAYMPAVPVLRLLIWFVPMSQLGTARSIWIVSEEKNKYPKKYAAWGVLINITLNALMIPKWGIIGATVATLITEFVTLLITPLFYKETRIHSRYIIEAITFNYKEKK